MTGAPLIGWVLAEIAPIGSPRTDPHARESMSDAARPSNVTLRAMITENRRSAAAIQGGSRADARTSIRFRVADAAAANYTPRGGDALVRVLTATGEVLDTTRQYLDNPRRKGGWVRKPSDWIADLSTDEPARRSA